MVSPPPKGDTWCSPSTCTPFVTPLFIPQKEKQKTRPCKWTHSRWYPSNAVLSLFASLQYVRKWGKEATHTTKSTPFKIHHILLYCSCIDTYKNVQVPDKQDLPWRHREIFFSPSLKPPLPAITAKVNMHVPPAPLPDLL